VRAPASPSFRGPPTYPSFRGPQGARNLDQSTALDSALSPPASRRNDENQLRSPE